MYVRDPSRVVVTGPLQEYAAGFCAELGRQGYAPHPAAEQVQLMAHLSRWLHGQGLGPAELTEQLVDRFLVDRRREYRKFRSGQGLRPLLMYLREIGVVPMPEPVWQDLGPEVSMLVEEYRQYLVRERGLAEVSV